ncbi:MAG: hypothetical protein ABI779_21630, partial [Acidobacteriota bacterium]
MAKVEISPIGLWRADVFGQAFGHAVRANLAAPIRANLQSTLKASRTPAPLPGLKKSSSGSG